MQGTLEDSMAVVLYYEFAAKLAVELKCDRRPVLLRDDNSSGDLEACDNEN